MTKKDFLALPKPGWEEEVICDSLIIIPGGCREIHDSGFRVMQFVASRKHEAICLLGGSTDAVHIDGLCGFGEFTPGGGIPSLIKPRSWTIDCLRKSGLLRLFCFDHNIKCGQRLSSFEIFAVPNEEPKNE